MTAQLTDEQKAKKKEQAKASWQRKKARFQERIAALPKIECECGCGTLIPPVTTHGKPRRYASSHGSRTGRVRVQHVSVPAWAKLAGPIFTDTPACYGDKDPDIFWDPESVDAARKVCARCPVRSECLDWALDNKEFEGVWGGTTGDERVLLARSRSSREIDMAAVMKAVTQPGERWHLRPVEMRIAASWLWKQGSSPEEIAERLGVTVRTVWRWRKREREATAV